MNNRTLPVQRPILDRNKDRRQTRTNKLSSLFVFSGIVVLSIMGGCAANSGGVDEDESEATESDLTGAAARSVSLKYEGTCAFLKNCSSFSKRLPAGKVSWGCTGVGACSDSAHWVAGPNRTYCGKSVRICRGTTCTTALVKDVSVSRDWEASNGVLDALSLPHALHGQCSGSGGGSVTVNVGGNASSSSSSSNERPPPATNNDNSDDTSSSADPTRGSDNGCYSATLDQDVPELTCVKSGKTGLVYQCKAGLWYRGVLGLIGPYAPCDGSVVRTAP